MDKIKRELADEAVNAYKDHETVVDPNIDKESEAKIAHILGQDLVQDRPDVFVETCSWCNVEPCLLDHGLYEAIETEYEYLKECDTENVLTHKEIRFKLYRTATRWIHGHLGRGNRRELPGCVVSEIKDLAHETGGLYTGFIESGFNRKESSFNKKDSS